jgi:hypothetical protein
MDECDTAAKVMECGKNTAPDIFEDIVNTVDLKNVVGFLHRVAMLFLLIIYHSWYQKNEVPLPRSRAKCFTSFNCVMEVSLKYIIILASICFHSSSFIAIQREKRDLFLSDAVTGVVYSVLVHNMCTWLIVLKFPKKHLPRAHLWNTAGRNTLFLRGR